MLPAPTDTLLRGLRQALGVVPRRSDCQLLTAFRVGDDAAFRVLLARHGALVLSACRQVLREEADIEDVFQATFLILGQRLGRRGLCLATTIRC